MRVEHDKPIKLPGGPLIGPLDPEAQSDLSAAPMPPETTTIVPNSRLRWLIREAHRAERMGQVEMGLDELWAVLAELRRRRGVT